MGAICRTGQQDLTGCGYYAGFVVSLVNKFGFSPGLTMSNEEVESARASFGKGSATLSEYDAASYLNQHLGVATAYTMTNPLYISSLDVKVCKSLDEGKAMMWGDIYHWWALVTYRGDTVIVYDPGGAKGYLTTVALEHIWQANFLVHPAWML